MPEIWRHTAVEGIEIGRLHRGRPATLCHIEPLIELWREAGPRGAEALVDPARAPFLGALADLVRRKEPGRLGAGQFGFVRRNAAMGEADLAGIFHLVTEMPVQLFAQVAVARHV